MRMQLAAGLSGFTLWFALLWFLSSQPGGSHPLPPVPQLDKVAHFGYFLIGGFLLCTVFLALPPTRPPRRALWLTVLLLALVGWLDEWRQTFVEGRSGNDLWDWLADVAGAAAGALARLGLRKFRP